MLSFKHEGRGLVQYHGPCSVPCSISRSNFNYPGWQRHEFRAFQEFTRDTGLRYDCLGFASSEHAVAVKFV